MRTPILCVSLLMIATLCSAQSSPASSTPSASDIPREIPVFDLNAIDQSIDPCADFYQYACGTWMKNNPIPPDKARWGRFDELFERNLFQSSSGEPGHGFGQALCRSHVRRRRQRANFEDGAGDRECDASGHWPVGLDVGHDQEECL